jgi:predicted secreted Zn-dependent protease
LLAAASLTGAASAQEIDVSERVEFYSVRGDSPEALLREMQAKGPTGVLDLGRRYFAQADSSVSWSYQYETTPSGCAVDTAEVVVETTYTYPSWEDREKASARLNAYWDHFLSRLEIHERGHADISRSAGAEIAKSIGATPPQADCPALEKAIKDVAGAVMKANEKRQRAYDRETNHGETQGAWFDVNEARRYRAPAAPKKEE